MFTVFLLSGGAILLLSMIIIFAFPQFSPIPYFPANKKDHPLIINSLQLRNNQVVFDLGAGEGDLLFAAAQKALEKKLSTRFIAVEINPILIAILRIKHFFHPNKKNIQVIQTDMFISDLRPYRKSSKNVTVFMYISPWYLTKMITRIKKQVSPFRLISYFYPVEKLRGAKINGVHPLYIYTIKKV